MYVYRRKAIDTEQANGLIARLRKYVVLLEKASPDSETLGEVRAIIAHYDKGSIPDPQASVIASASTMNAKALHAVAYDLLALSTGHSVPESIGHYYRFADDYGLSFT